MDYSWNILEPSEKEREVCRNLETGLHISATFAWLLVRRGVMTEEQARVFITPRREPLLDPFLMKDMDKAVCRLEKAKREKERILVYGDYDVDGVTAVALMVRFLKMINIPCLYYIPDRNTEGYGLSKKGIEYAINEGCQLIITLDCGISDVESIRYALEHDIQAIICDHHNIGERLPSAFAILDMKREECAYPYKDLSGCGVGFKLVQAYCQKNGIVYDSIAYLLQLVALSIACDIVSMTGENRLMEARGLEQMRYHPIMGIDALLQIAQVNKNDITTEELAFRIGPRINASGRLYSAMEALELLISDNAEEVLSIAIKLNRYNEERQRKVRDTEEEAIDILRQTVDFEAMHATVVYAPHWHKGVIGITASSLINHYYRPTIVLTDDQQGNIVGSARSVGSFDIYKAIRSNQHLLIKYGGHRSAAGICLKKENLKIFQQCFDQYVRGCIEEKDTHPFIDIDCCIGFSEINERLYRLISAMQPYGPGNLSPTFVTRHVYDTGETRIVGKTGTHLKLSVRDKDGNTISGIAFGMGEWASYIKSGQPFSLCYKIEKNTFNEVTTLQIKIKDIKKE